MLRVRGICGRLQPLLLKSHSCELSTMNLVTLSHCPTRKEFAAALTGVCGFFMRSRSNRSRVDPAS